MARKQSAAAPRRRLRAPHRPIRVAVLITDDATLLDFAGPWEVFFSTRTSPDKSHPWGKPEFDLYTVGPSRKAVSSSGLRVLPDHTIRTAPPPDIVLVGAQGGGLGDPTFRWIRRQAENGAILASVCTGAFILGELGVFDGKLATTHHAYIGHFAKSYPKARVVRRRRFVRGGEKLFSAGGVSSGVDLALHLVELYFGRTKARQVADRNEYFWNPTGSKAF